MTRAEAVKMLKSKMDGHTDTSYEWAETVRMAIKALEQQTCEDAVSRAAVLDIFADNADATRPYSTAWEKIRDLPPVNPQPKTRWIPVSERLPEDSELVLFSTKTDRVFEGRFLADNTDRQWYAFRDETFAWNNVVTAWMPLPKPYEPQESEEEE